MLFLKGLDSFCERAEKFLIASGIIIMAAVAIINVISRNLFSNSFSWVEEVSQFAIVIVTFVGTSYGARKGLHIRMSMLPDMLHKTRYLGKLLAIIIALGTAAFMFYLTWYSVFYVKGLFGMNKYTLGLQIPVYIMMIWIPLGFFSSGVQYSLTFLRNLTADGVYLAPDVMEGDS